jgi:hypothetical protein
LIYSNGKDEEFRVQQRWWRRAEDLQSERVFLQAPGNLRWRLAWLSNIPTPATVAGKQLTTDGHMRGSCLARTWQVQKVFVRKSRSTWPSSVRGDNERMLPLPWHERMPGVEFGLCGTFSRTSSEVGR